MLTREEFSVLSGVAMGKQPTAITDTAQPLPEQVEEQIVAKLTKEGMLKDRAITQKGLSALEPYRVKNAVIMAAGESSRFAPMCYHSPKGLLRVKGQVLIERQIEQLKQFGIEDILVVVGYMGEKFAYLREKYGVQIINNPEYYRYNNTYTLMLVADRLDNTYICSSDNYFAQNVFEPYVYQAYYAGEYAPEKTVEYCMQTDQSGQINSVSIGGGPGAWYMIGQAYFDRAFSGRFVQLLGQYANDEKVKGELWENLFMAHIDQLPMLLRRYHGVIYEFDSLQELRAFDTSYWDHTGSPAMENICRVLGCKEREIDSIQVLRAGLTNNSFLFTCRGKQYVYRHPGRGTETFIHRDGELFSMEVAKRLHLDDTFIAMDPVEGWKICHYVKDAHTMDYHNWQEVEQAMGLLRKLHTAPKKSRYEFDLKNGIADYMGRVEQLAKNTFGDFEELLQNTKQLFEYTDRDNVPKCLCHSDCFDLNFLVDPKGKMYLIDWEYSGNGDPAADLGVFICCSDYNYQEALRALQLYYGGPLTPAQLRHSMGYIAIASFYWLLWAVFQESRGYGVGDFLQLWHQYAAEYGKIALKLYTQNQDK